MATRHTEGFLRRARLASYTYYLDVINFNKSLNEETFINFNLNSEYELHGFLIDKFSTIFTSLKIDDLIKYLKISRNIIKEYKSNYRPLKKAIYM